MVIALTLLFPVLLLVFLLVMERVERPLRVDAVGEKLVTVLATARPDEIEDLVTEGFGPALDGYWRRRRLVRRLRTASRG